MKQPNKSQNIKHPKNELLKIHNTVSLKNMIQLLLQCKNPFIGIDAKPCVISIEPKNLFK